MGGTTSKLSLEQRQDLNSRFNFSTSEITNLHNRFLALDTDKDDHITRSELLWLPELVNNPLRARVLALCPHEKEKLTFEDMLETLKPFSAKSPQSLKIKAAFKMYDVDNSGEITHCDLVAVLRLLMNELMSEEELDVIAKKAMTEADADGNAAIDEEEFDKIMAPVDLRERMSFEVKRGFRIKRSAKQEVIPPSPAPAPEQKDESKNEV
ncbi:hypothetical protein P9112_014610 [Eukaryota sp. TZLM1-RC]